MTGTTSTHGLDGTLVAPDWPPLTLAELRTLLAQFPTLGQPIRVASVSPRPFSAAGVVVAEDSSVFIKRHHVSVRDREGLLEEHRFLAHLHSRGAAVPSVVASASGETAITIADSTYEIHEIPSGIDLYQDAISWTPFLSAAHARSAGESLARLHLAAQDFSAPPRKRRPLVASFSIFAHVDPSAAMRRYLAARPALAAHPPARACADQALDILAPFYSELAPFLSALPPLWTHNDLHASNLFWSDKSPNARATAVIDFGLADRTNAVHDIAHAIERNIVEWLVLVNDPAHPEAVPFHFDHLHALLSGYESVRPLSLAERAALAPMAALCHAEFTLSEADYFLGVLHSPEKAAMAYDGWLVGHARWFRGPGRKLIDAIRLWASACATHPDGAAAR
jgi:Ser/Thr protein kinase RdoA (MazF antagonist)